MRALAAFLRSSLAGARHALDSLPISYLNANALTWAFTRVLYINPVVVVIIYKF